MSALKAPFPYFGGKSAVAAEVWRRFGNVKNYVEPFFGSGAVLLGRPHWRPDGPRLVETVNDADGLLVNFWRAVQRAPDAVALHADTPPSEVENVARHEALRRLDLGASLMSDPRWFDAEAAGWWASCMAGCAIGRDLFTEKAFPKPLHSGRRGTESMRGGDLVAGLWSLALRFAATRIKHGDWSRCVRSPSAMGGAAGDTFGVFLDPPYAGTDAQYATDGAPERDAWAWACEHGDDPGFRICVAGYDDGREVPEGWVAVAWEAAGGYGNKADGEGRANARRERLWFSPHCLRPDEGQMVLL